jgi:hypothetical protein
MPPLDRHLDRAAGLRGCSRLRDGHASACDPTGGFARKAVSDHIWLACTADRMHIDWRMGPQ